MKYLLTLFAFLALTNCTTTELVETWKNPDTDSYLPYKVLVVGMTPNTEARLKFEQQIKNELELRGIEAVISLELFDTSLESEKMTQERLKTLEGKLINDGFDTVLFTKVIGVEDKIAYKESFYNYDITYRKFKDDYLMYQDIYYNPEYYDEYTVYHAETSLYCICSTKDRELLWKGYVDIIDPQSIDETVNDYVQLLIDVLEQQQLISPKIKIEKTLQKEVLQ